MTLSKTVLDHFHLVRIFTQENYDSDRMIFMLPNTERLRLARDFYIALRRCFGEDGLWVWILICCAIGRNIHTIAFFWRSFVIKVIQQQGCNDSQLAIRRHKAVPEVHLEFTRVLIMNQYDFLFLGLSSCSLHTMGQSLLQTFIVDAVADKFSQIGLRILIDFLEAYVLVCTLLTLKKFKGV